MNLSQILLYTLDKILLAALISFISSGLFFWVLSFLRPRLKISSEIARGNNIGDGRRIYRIKIINKTSYPIVNIRAQLHLMTSFHTAGGFIYKSKEIHLKRSDPIVIEKFNIKDKDADYAYRFVTYEDLDFIWDDDSLQFLRFRLICTHSFSGFGRYFMQDYYIKRKSIIDGNFEKGNSLDVV